MRFLGSHGDPEVRACLSVLAEVHARTAQAEHRLPSSGISVVAARDVFKEVEKVVALVFSNLNKEELAQLMNPKTSAKAKKKFVVDLLKGAGIPEEELPREKF